MFGMLVRQEVKPQKPEPQPKTPDLAECEVIEFQCAHGSNGSIILNESVCTGKTSLLPFQTATAFPPKGTKRSSGNSLQGESQDPS